MEAKEKKFKCQKCGHESYADFHRCKSCYSVDTIKPISPEDYACYMNGSFYGSGPREYMSELVRDYVVNAKMYGKKAVDFKIERMKLDAK